MWVDYVLFMNASSPRATRWRRPPFDVIVADGGDEVNAGIFAVRNSAGGFAFLKAYGMTPRQREGGHLPWRDNGYLNHAVLTRNCGRCRRCVPDECFMAGLHGSKHKFRQCFWRFRQSLNGLDESEIGGPRGGTRARQHRRRGLRPAARGSSAITLVGPAEQLRDQRFAPALCRRTSRQSAGMKTRLGGVGYLNDAPGVRHRVHADASARRWLNHCAPCLAAWARHAPCSAPSHSRMCRVWIRASMEQDVLRLALSQRQRPQRFSEVPKKTIIAEGLSTKESTSASVGLIVFALPGGLTVWHTHAGVGCVACEIVVPEFAGLNSLLQRHTVGEVRRSARRYRRRLAAISTSSRQIHVEQKCDSNSLTPSE